MNRGDFLIGRDGTPFGTYAYGGQMGHRFVRFGNKWPGENDYIGSIAIHGTPRIPQMVAWTVFPAIAAFARHFAV